MAAEMTDPECKTLKIVDTAEANVWAGIVLGALVLATLAGGVIDLILRVRRRQRPQPREAKQSEAQSSGYWAILLMIACYAILIPGYVDTLFDYNVSVLLFGTPQRLGANSENTVELIRGLAKDGVLLAAFFVCFYAMVVPIIKALLLVTGWVLTWRYSHSTECTLWARRCIVFVQKISKWASPDMFAYLQMLCLFRALNHEPTLTSTMHLGRGFTCFSLFCVASTVASIGLHPPAARQEVAVCRAPLRVAVALVSLLVVAFAALFWVGLFLPSMELRLDMDLLYNKRPILKMFSSIIDAMGLAELMHAKVSIYQSVVGLATWTFDGEMNSLIGFLMYSTLVVTLPIIDMALISIMAALLATGRLSLQQRAHRVMITTARVLRKLAMLDVSLVGTFVVVLALVPWRQNGVILSTREGAYALTTAEVCHYLAAWLVEQQLSAYTEGHTEPANEKNTETTSIAANGASNHAACCADSAGETASGGPSLQEDHSSHGSQSPSSYL